MAVIRGEILIDGTGADPISGGPVTVEGDRIRAIDGKRSRTATSYERLDLEGCTVVPGLIDAHVHLGISSNIEGIVNRSVSVAEQAANIFRVCSETLDEGFTTVRDAGGIDGGLVQSAAKGLVRAPRIICCGPLLAQCGGHGHLASPWSPTESWHELAVPGLAPLSRVCDGPDDVRRAAREAFRSGASFLKMCVSGGVTSVADSLEDTQFSNEEIRTAVEEARSRHTYVTVHALNVTGIRNAITSGVKCVEHGSGLDEETAAQMAEQGAHLVPTLAVAHTYREHFDVMGLPESIRDRVIGVEQGMVKAIHAARTAGVLVGSGSDYIGPVQSRRGLELVLKAEIIGPMEAIVSATSVNARILGIDDRLGSLEVGKIADIVAFDGDALENPKILGDPGRVALVMKEGKVVLDRRAELGIGPSVQGAD